jgi:YgiT-type zinc finger domain-containing protein
MRCPICKDGDTRAGVTSVTLEGEAKSLVMKDVPAQVCRNCGEAFVEEEQARRLLATNGRAKAQPRT